MSRAGAGRKELAEALAAGFRRLTDAINRYEATVAERLGMHPTDLQFLGLVDLHGPTTPGTLAELSGLTTGAVTGVIDRLERAGYVQREDDPEDRRRVVIRAVAGRHQVERLYDPLRRVSGLVYDRYSEDELATVLDVVDRLQPRIVEAAAGLLGGSAAQRSEVGGETLLRAPVHGLAEATLRFPRGAGHLGVVGDPTVTDLFEAHFVSKVATAKVDGGVVSVQYRSSPFGWRAKHGKLRLNTSVAWRLEMVGGCSRFEADLSHLRLLGFSLTGGASHASLTLPRPEGVVPVRITGGVNDVTLLRPAGSAAVLRVRGGAVNVTVDGQRSGAVGGEWRWNAGPTDADDRYEIEIVGGARTVVIGTVG